MQRMVRIPGRERILGRLASLVAVVAVIAVLALVLSAVHILPQLRNPFTESTIDRSQPVVLKSITRMSRYEAANGTFQVVVDLARQASFLPSFIEGSDTLFIGQGNVIGFVDFSRLKGSAIQVSPDRTAVTILLPHAQLAPAVLNVRQSYVFAQQQGLLNKIGDFFSGNPNSQQRVYLLAVRKINVAAHRSPLVKDAEKNTESMLEGLLRSLAFRQINVTFGSTAAVAANR